MINKLSVVGGQLSGGAGRYFRDPNWHLTTGNWELLKEAS
jgi:hypothetical protein